MVYSAISDSSGTVSQFTRYVNVTLTHSGALTDYQKKLTIAYQAGMQAGFGDIRFNIWNGTAWEYVPYWLESKTDSDTADVWIENDYADGDTIVRMYYGNNMLISESNGDDTFIQFKPPGSGTYFESLVVSPTNVIFESRIKMSGSTGNPRWGLANTVGLITDDALQISYAAGTTYLGNYNEGTNSAFSSGSFLTIGAWYDIKIISTADTTYGYVDGSEITPAITSQRPDETLGLCSITTGDITLEHTYVRARKYAVVEPTYTIGTPHHQRRQPQYI